MTSSYSSRCLRDLEVLRFDGLLRALDALGDHLATRWARPLPCPAAPAGVETHCLAKMRMRSSSSERKKRDSPGSPWRPARPRSWLSMRRDSWRSVPRMKRPPASMTFSCSCCAASAWPAKASAQSWLGDLELLALVIEAQETGRRHGIDGALGHADGARLALLHQLLAGHEVGDCRRAECRCRGRPCWWRW